MTLEMQIPEKLMPFITKQKRYKVAYGGRGGAKSMTIAGMLSHKVQVEQALVGCLREFQNSLDDSVFALIKSEVKRLKIPGFKNYTNKIKHKDGGGFRFRGLARSIDAIKSMFGFSVAEFKITYSRNIMKTGATNIRPKDLLSAPICLINLLATIRAFIWFHLLP